MTRALFKLIYRKYINNLSNKRKIEYLRKLGTKVGDGTRFNCDLSVVGSEPYLVTIGSNCLFAGEVKIFTHDGGVSVINNLFYQKKSKDKIKNVVIGDNCFIGFRSIILPGVTIGNNCIIGAGSVVSKNIPENSVAAGVPAKVICSIDEYHEKCKSYLLDTGKLSKEKKQKYLESLYKES